MFNFTSNQKLRQQNETEVPETTGKGKEIDPYAKERMAEIEKQRLAFVKKNPDFDMRAEMENPDFVTYVWGRGLTVEEAYILVHREELLEKARQNAQEEKTLPRERILENGAGKNRPAIAKKNPKDLTDKEVDAIIERVRNGEKISF
ncbi:MAG: hypothetical protein J6A56_05510 [Clostridia bacterium]|nr:hypothetical protein [Clostridia bacterium]